MSEESDKTNKFYCANCANCKIFVGTVSDGKKIQKVRCAAGHWKKASGGEKFYNYANVLKRTQTECTDYDAIGDSRPFIRKLKKTIPSKENTYISD